ncbi:MAG: methylmalonyl Co-A mutase-associated GTPase MeaB [Deltaproteobacteria bacterium]|nr:methylmalonyl Co-A mutase-associated GTPase MeaB [Deltaproteobacteria bacterium]
MKKFANKDRNTLSRLITLVENHDPASLKILTQLHKDTGQTHIIGITGPPGAGKSSLINQLIKHIVDHKMTVAVLATDPSSPYTGGSILGDRIRMQEQASHENVYVRSLSTRGSRGGLSRATFDALKILDAFGFDFVILETVGVGQTEVDVMHFADTVILVLVPESGDDIQTMKAGIMEIADIFVINKSDRPGADTMKRNLLELKSPYKELFIYLTQALQGKGIESLWTEILKRKKSQKIDTENESLQRREELSQIILSELEKKLHQEKTNPFRSVYKDVQKGALNPYEGAVRILKKMEKN